MSSVASEPRPAASRIAGRWREWLVLGGGGALVAGALIDRTWEALPHPQRLAETVVLAVLAVLAALALRAWRGWPAASGLALVAIAGVAVFDGPLPLLAALLLALGATAAGRLAAGGVAALPVGLALVAAAGGWLLPLPVHARWTYVLVLGALAAWRWRELRAAGAGALAAWEAARAAAPRAAFLAMLVLFLASTGTWVPTMQYDDIAYHLGLPHQLQATGAYALDPTHHVWALAPWAGDVLHGIAQVLAGQEARGAVNLLWLGIGAAGVHRMAGLFGASATARWSAVALFASLPMTLALAAGMQTELPGAAALAWLACLVADDDGDAKAARRVVAGAILFGLLWALKLMHAAVALPLLAWAAWRHRAALARSLRSAAGLARLVQAGLLAAAVGGSSYAYAWLVAGNPVLPLMNATFRSPYFPAQDFADDRWQQGLDLALPWNLTFDTHRYFEGADGALGFVLVAALGAWVLALLRPRTRAFTLAATAGLLLAVLPLQYARYVYPSLVLLLPALVAAVDGALPVSRAAWLAGALCVAQLAFHGNGYWMLRGGAVGRSVVALGADAPVLEKYAPERVLVARMREAGTTGRVLVLATDPHAFAELGTQGRTVSWYAPALVAAAHAADAQADGRAWAALFRQEGVTDVLLREAALQPAQRAGLARLGALRMDAVGAAEWWRIPEPAQ